MKEKQSAKSGTDQIAEIYRSCYKDVYKYVYRHIPNVQMAEDIAQETFLAALEKVDEFLAHPNPKHWLIRTARNKMYELCRWMKYWSCETLDESMTEPKADVRLEYEEVNLAALAILSAEEWTLFKRRYLYGESIGELADSLGIKENNMSVRLTRIKQKLRDGMR